MKTTKSKKNTKLYFNQTVHSISISDKKYTKSMEFVFENEKITKVEILEKLWQEPLHEYQIKKQYRQYRNLYYLFLEEFGKGDGPNDIRKIKYSFEQKSTSYYPDKLGIENDVIQKSDETIYLYRDGKIVYEEVLDTNGISTYESLQYHYGNDNVCEYKLNNNVLLFGPPDTPEEIIKQFMDILRCVRDADKFPNSAIDLIRMIMQPKSRKRQATSQKKITDLVANLSLHVV